ncbi:protein of unknown function [Paraburkholderia kururiensis]
MADEEVPHTRQDSHRHRIHRRADHGCPGERQNGSLRFTVARSTLNPEGFYRQSRRVERVSVLEAPAIGNRGCQRAFHGP